MNETQFEYDVAISYAGEDRKYVSSVVRYLKQKGVKVFYDKNFTVEMWGKSLTEYFKDIFAKKSKYVVAFISENYLSKKWTKYERRIISSIAIERENYFLPVMMDEEQEIPGISDVTMYINANNYNPSQLAKLIIGKINSDDTETITKQSHIDIELIKNILFVLHCEAGRCNANQIKKMSDYDSQEDFDLALQYCIENGYMQEITKQGQKMFNLTQKGYDYCEEFGFN